MAISQQQLTIYLYSAHRAVIFAIAQLSCISCHLNPQLREVKFNSKLKDSLHWCYDIFAFLVDCRMYTRAGEYVVLFHNYRFLVGFMSSGF